MHGVATEVAEEVLMFLQHCNRHALASQQVAEHDARRTASHYAASGFQRGIAHNENIPFARRIGYNRGKRSAYAPVLTWCLSRQVVQFLGIPKESYDRKAD